MKFVRARIQQAERKRAQRRKAEIKGTHFEFYRTERGEKGIACRAEAGIKKKCSFLVLILQDDTNGIELYNVPSNMIILNCYELEMQKRIGEYISKHYQWKQKIAEG